MKRYLARALLALLLTALSLVHVSGLHQWPYVDEIENLMYDTRVRLSAPRGIDERIVIVAIDEASLEALGHWPWTREKLALMVEQMFAYGVTVVGFDALFAERDESADVDLLRELATRDGDGDFVTRLDELAPQLDRDRRFAEGLTSGPAILGYYFTRDEKSAFETGDLPMSAFELHESMMDSVFLPRAKGYTSNLPVLMESAWTAGFIDNPLIDQDGVVRRAPLLQEYNLSVYESLSLATAATFFNDITLPIFVDASTWMGDYPPLEGLELAGKPIPIDPQGAVLVPYRGPAGSFPYVSVKDIINGTVEDPSVLEGAIVLVGATAPGMQDLRSTPFGSIYPGVEVHANVVAGILDNNFRWEPAYTAALEMITVALFGLLTALLLPVLKPIISTVVFMVMMAVALGINMYLWQIERHVLPLAMTMYTLTGVYVINMVFGYLFESRSRHMMDGLFGQYVPPDLVKEMSRDPQNYSLASRKLELSVLFSDIRSFTTISEGLDAAELSELMNQYLTPMTRIVHETEGTIDKYIGDAVMAFWGAPVRDAEHASKAVKAGLAMQAALDDLNIEFDKQGWPEIKIGVGINTGQMSVGNMGSQFRKAYTVLGDAVNLGSRLEGITKVYGVGFIVAESTAEKAHEFYYRELDRVRVKGKAEPVTILEPLGLKSEIAPETLKMAEEFREALLLYRKQNWDEAQEALEKLLNEDPGTYLYELYLERITIFRKDPPGEYWDGVFTHESK
jgi:adenylate cyclase